MHKRGGQDKNLDKEISFGSSHRFSTIVKSMHPAFMFKAKEISIMLWSFDYWRNRHCLITWSLKRWQEFC
ncbi:unnamed protein product [Calypogeia fissa]